MGYRNLFNIYGLANPEEERKRSLYQQGLIDQERFLKNQQKYKKQQEDIYAQQRGQPTVAPIEVGPLSGLKETVGGWFDPKPISKADYDAAGNPMFTYDKTTVPEYTTSNQYKPGETSVSVAGGRYSPEAQAAVPVGKGNIPVDQDGSGMHPGEESGYQPLGTRNPTPTEVTTQTGSHDEYTKSIDRSFLAAMLQSAIPQKKEAPQARAVSSGAVGRTTMPEMTPFLTGLRPKKKNPALWRYS